MRPDRLPTASSQQIHNRSERKCSNTSCGARTEGFNEFPFFFLSHLSMNGKLKGKSVNHLWASRKGANDKISNSLSVFICGTFRGNRSTARISWSTTIRTPLGSTLPRSPLLRLLMIKDLEFSLVCEGGSGDGKAADVRFVRDPEPPRPSGNLAMHIVTSVPSGSGFSFLQTNQHCSLPIILVFTTRPRRSNGASWTKESRQWNCVLRYQAQHSPIIRCIVFNY